ncbi:MAG: DUF4153 domain-containing protein [Bacteroidota bacterium]
MAKFRFSSIDGVWQQAVNTIKRFPVASAAGIAAAITGCVILEYFEEGGEFKYRVSHILFCLLQAISLGAAFTIIAENNRAGSKMLWHAAAVILTVLYGCFIFPVHQKENDWLIYGCIIVATHLLVAVAPYISRYNEVGFWYYNERLFIRLIEEALYVIALGGGISIALGACTLLLKVEFKPELYGQIWFVVLGVFGTLFFLNGVPKDIKELEIVDDYPKWLLNFTRFVLIPLVFIYILILYAYSGKLIMAWELPEGYVGKMYLSLAVEGIFALLIIYPLRKKPEMTWIGIFWRSYFIIMLPLTGLMYLGIFRRIADYGVTEERYLVVALALWITLIIVYFILPSARQIRFIPASLLILLLVITFGPWGFESVSIRSQYAQLEQSIKETNKVIMQYKGNVPFEKAKLLRHRNSDLVFWFSERNALHETKALWKHDVDSLLKVDLVRKDSAEAQNSLYHNNYGNYNKATERVLLSETAVNYSSDDEDAGVTERIYLELDNKAVLSAIDYQHMIICNLNSSRTESSEEFNLPESVNILAGSERIILKNGQSEKVIQLDSLYMAVYNKAKENRHDDMDAAYMSFSGNSIGLKWKIVFQKIWGSKTLGKAPDFDGVDYYMFISTEEDL